MPGRLLWINLINEYDVVTRLDKGYGIRLLDLFRSAQLGRIEETPPRNPRVWRLAEPDLAHVGEKILLVTRLSSNNLIHQHDEDPTGTSDHVDHSSPRRIDLRAMSVSLGELSQLVFCRTSVHKLAVYRSNIEQIPVSNET